MEYYSALKKKFCNLGLHRPPSRTLCCVKQQTQEGKRCEIPLTRSIRNGQVHRIKEWNRGVRSWGESEELLINEHKVSVKYTLNLHDVICQILFQ